VNILICSRGVYNGCSLYSNTTIVVALTWSKNLHVHLIFIAIKLVFVNLLLIHS
jgi:hypothetical protein